MLYSNTWPEETPLWLSSSGSVCFSLSWPGCLRPWTGFSQLLPRAQPRSRGSSTAKGCWPQTMTCPSISPTWSCLCSVCPAAPCTGFPPCKSTALMFLCCKHGCACSMVVSGARSSNTWCTSCAGNVCLVPGAQSWASDIRGVDVPCAHCSSVQFRLFKETRESQVLQVLPAWSCFALCIDDEYL